MIFFYLSKILSFILSPFVWILILLVFAFIKRNKKNYIRYVIASFLVALVFSNPFIANEAIRLWELPTNKIDSLKTPYDVGIVLGGGMITIDENTDRLAFRENTDRIFQAVQLYKMGKIKKILISSGAGNLTYRNMLEADLLKKYLVSLNIPDSVLIAESISDNTFQNAFYTKKILKKTEFKNGKFLLITSALHMRRAKACFIKQGIKFDIYTTNKLAPNRSFIVHQLFVPEIEAMFLWEKLLHEISGYVVYYFMNYI